MNEQRKIEVDGQPFNVMDEGDCFVETDRKRYSWDIGELKYSPHRITPDALHDNPEKALRERTGRDIVVLTLRGCSSNTCWITWSDGMRAIYKPPQIEDVSGIYAVPGRRCIADSREYGQLTVYGDFETVMFAHKSYDLRDAQNARNILRFLCLNALGKANAKCKSAIREHVDTVNSDWRPSQDFRGNLEPLYKSIGGHRGKYWLKD